MPALRDFVAPIIGKIDPEVHWQSSNPPRPVDPVEKVKQRMPSVKVELAIFERDGWRCRFCEVMVISRKARNKLVSLFPTQARWGPSSSHQHCALSSLSSSLDHLVPHSRGGDNSEANLVTACTACQFGRNRWLLEEVGFNDPRQFPPIVDSWDGLTRLIV